MVRNGRVDVDGIDTRILKQLPKVAVAFLHSKGVTDGVELLPGPLADRVEAGMGMPLVNEDELRPETQTKDGDVYFILGDMIYVV